MEILDLTDSYLEYFIGKNDLDSYLQIYPALFEHYFQYWTNNKTGFVRLTKEQVHHNKNLVLKSVEKISPFFEQNNIDTSNVKIVLFVGQKCTNGHAFIDSGKAVTWIPVEEYETRIYSDTFCTHEIIHGIHYSIDPDYYFKNKFEKELIGRHLITEGAAVYLTKALLRIDDGTALWADCLSKEKINSWTRECEAKCSEIKNFIYENFHSSDKSGNLFYLLADIENAADDPFNSRGGYWLGLKLIEKIRKQNELGLKDILTIPKEDFENKILTELQTSPDMS